MYFPLLGSTSPHFRLSLILKASHPVKEIPQNPFPNTSMELEASSSSSGFAPTSFSRSCNYDVFLSFRGEDTRKKFVDHLYEALKQRIFNIYKDDETLPRSEYIIPSLVKAIEESRIAIIVFSKNYADSSWCLNELAYIMRCKVEKGLIVMPIFYDVEPSDVRKQKGDFGKAFAKQEAENTDKVELWRKALADASNIAGWEPKNTANGHESQVIKKIVDGVFDTLFPLKSKVDEDLVGMRARLYDLEPLLDIWADGVRMVGIWGVGGSGKTTLASFIFHEIAHNFQGQCILGSVREESSKYNLKKLQENMLSTIFKTCVKVQDVVEGKLKIKRMLCNRKVLVLLDDVDELDQLDALVGSHSWFGSGSRIIITTRNEHLLRTRTRVHVYPVRLLSDEEAFQLFKTHAYNEVDPVEDYEKLSLRVVSYSAGLPLALKVLGSFLYDKKKKVWMSTLARLQDIPDKEIVKILKVSYDALEMEEKELFLDIACFWRGKSKDDAMEVLEAFEFYPEIGIEVLRQMALISIVDGCFDMHDLVQEMGHHIVRGEHRKNPEKHSRVWKNEEINNMCLRDAIAENDTIEAIKYDCYHDVHSSRFLKIVSSMKMLRYLSVSTKGYDHGHSLGMYDVGLNFLSNELRYMEWNGFPASSFPESFQPMNLVILKIRNSLQEELWKGCKHLPHLKVLVLEEMKKLHSTPDFGGLPSLQKCTLDNCDELKEIHQSLGDHTSLEYVRISRCRKLIMFPRIVQMENLKELNLSNNGFSKLDIINLSELTQLKLLNLSGCGKLCKLPNLPSNLTILKADYCKSLTSIGDCYQNCKWLGQVSLMGGGIIQDGTRLLEFMLRGATVGEDRSMLLLLQGTVIPERFRPCLLDGSKLRLQFPVQWRFNHCGFLLCAILQSAYNWSSSLRICLASSTYSQVVKAWKKSDSDKYTLMWYVPFDSLTQTEWWEQTLGCYLFDIEYKGCSGIGVMLVRKKSGHVLREKSIGSSDYTPEIKIQQDNSNALAISFKLL